MKLEDKLNSHDPDEKILAEEQVTTNMHLLTQYATYRRVSFPSKQTDKKVEYLRAVGTRFQENDSQDTKKFHDAQIHRIFCNVYDSYVRQVTSLPQEMQERLEGIMHTRFNKTYAPCIVKK